MRFNRRRQESTIRREARARGRFRPGRARTLESLERREMLAGDVSSPWQNPLNPRDVNFDQRVSPLDALLVINDLALRGSHPLDAPLAAPLAATQNPPNLRYLDVNGDNRVSLIDALMVINELADVELMLVHTYPTDMAGTPITSIGEGAQYKLRTDVMDIRDPVSALPGVFSAFDDVTFNALLSSIDVGQTVEFGPFFNLVRLSTLAQGRVIAGGAAQSLSPPGNAVQMLWSVVLTATNSGMQTFTPAFSTDPNHENLLYGNDNVLMADEIQFVGATLTITSALPTLAIGGVSQAENSGAPFNFTVTLSEAASEDVTVNFATTDGAGANGATTADNDYLATSGTLTFTPGQTMLVVPVTVNGDTKVEPNETFNVVLSGVSSNASIGTSVGVGTILNDDSLAAISIAPVTVNNVTSGTTTATFTVSLSAVPANTVTVRFATSDITAIDGVDYVGTSGTLTFNAGGGVTQTIPVTILGDSMVDDVDTFLVTLSDPTNATIQTSQALGTILPAVSAPSVTIDDVTRQEGLSGSSNFVFTVTLSAPATQEAKVAFATADDTATAPSDYTAQSGTITFAPGQFSSTISIAVLGDAIAEPTESFVVNLTAIEGAVGNVQGRGTIVDDDGTPTLTISDATVTAGTGLADAVFTVTLSGLVTQQVSVGFATADNEAVAGIDYLAKTGNLTFSLGGEAFQEIHVTILGSGSPQPDKTFFVNLSSQAPPSVVIGDDRGIGTIITQGISISDVNVVEGNTSTTPAVFTVTLSRTFTDVVTVAYATADGTATTAGSDYVPTGGTLTFEAGVTSLTVTVPVVGDTDPEGNETFSVNLSGAVGAPLFRSQGIGTILNDDGAKVAMRLELADLLGTPLPMDATLDVNDEFLLRVFVADVQAVPTGVAQAYLDVMFQADVVMVNGSATFGPFFQNFPTGSFQPGLLNDFGAFGQTQPPADPSQEQLLYNIPFKAIDVGVVIFSGSVSTLDAGHDILVYTSDDPVQPDAVNIINRSINIGANVFTITGDAKPEGTNLVFTVTRFLPTNSPATVVFTTVDGTATAGQDYVAVSGTLTFLPGDSTTQTVTVVVNDDAIDEPDESFSIVLSDAMGASASNLPATGTIEDNDGSVSVSVGNATGAEGTNLVFNVSLSSASGKAVTVAFSTTASAGGNAATANVDYTPVSGTLTFNPGIVQQFVTVAALNDIVLEPNETFQLAISNPGNATLGAAQGQGTIVDVPPAGISGFVYVDLNNNGVKENNESGIAGAIVSVTRASNGDTQSTVTGADGSYSFVGLFPDTYAIKETQPGFYSDGRDTRFGVDSPANDQFSGIVLAPMAAETGFHFGELGIRSEFISAFINRRALFATAVVSGILGPTLNMPGTVLDLRTGDIWVSFDGGWQGLRTIDALFNSSQGSVTMKLYNNALQEVASSIANATGASLLFNGQAGLPYFLRISGSNPNVTVNISETPLPGALSPPAAGGSSGESGSSNNSSSSATSPSGRFASSTPTTQPLIAPAMEPLVSTEASDEALAEDDDWVLESLLA